MKKRASIEQQLRELGKESYTCICGCDAFKIFIDMVICSKCNTNYKTTTQIMCSVENETISHILIPTPQLFNNIKDPLRLLSEKVTQLKGYKKIYRKVGRTL